MPIVQTLREWDRQPPYRVQVDTRRFGPVSAWTPSCGLMDAGDGKRSHLSRGSVGLIKSGRHGQTFAYAGADFSNAFTLDQSSGAPFECWLVLYAAAPKALSLNATLGHTTACMGSNAARNPLIRASATNVLVGTTQIGAGDAVFYVGKNADYRIYHRGVKATAAAAFGHVTSMTSIGEGDGDEWPLFARWAGEIPPDDLIWQLLENPWQLFEPEVVLMSVPVAGADIILASATASAAPSITAGAITQLHQLNTAAATAAPSVNAGAVGQVHQLNTAAAAAAPVITSQAIGQPHMLTPMQAAASGTAVPGLISQSHLLSPAASAATAATTVNPLTQGGTALDAATATAGATTSSNTITQSHYLSGVNAIALANAEAQAIAQAHGLTALPAYSDGVAVAEAITQTHFLSGAGAAAQAAHVAGSMALGSLGIIVKAALINLTARRTLRPH